MHLRILVKVDAVVDPEKVYRLGGSSGLRTIQAMMEQAVEKVKTEMALFEVIDVVVAHASKKD